MTPGGVRHLIRLAVVAAVYFAAGRLGLSLAVVHDSASAVWPPTGVAVAAGILFGRGIWPAVFAGAFLVNLSTNGSLAASLGIATGNTLEAVVATFLVTRLAGGAQAFERAANAFRFAALAGVLSPVVAASIGVISLIGAGLAESADAGTVWVTWWLGDVGGALLVAPPIILWSRRNANDLRPGRPVEGALLAATVIVAAFAVFGELSPIGRNQFPIAYMCIPVLLWAAFRFGPRETATCSAVLAVLAIRGTLIGYGPFAPQSPNDGLLLLQAFMSIAAVCSLAAAAEASHRREREAQLQALNDELEDRVRRRTMALERAQERLNEAQHVAHIGSWEWDVGGDRVWWSDEMYRTFGIDPASLPASYDAFLRHVHPDDRAAVQQYVGDALRSQQPFAFEHRIVTPDARVRRVSARGDVVRDAEQRPIRMRGTAQDVTEQRHAEEARAALRTAEAARVEAEEANRMKDQFLATLSHELRTPLHAVIGWSQMLLHGTVDPAHQQRALKLIHRNALLQSGMISDLLDVSRIATGAFTLERSALDLPTLLESTVETVRPKAIEKEIDLRCEIDPAAWVVGDGQRLIQVAGNLLVNAVKFTPAGGRVMLRLTRAGEAVRLQVEDNGPGISPEFLPHVFERFRQEDQSLTREHGGLGLGLAIVRHIVELHGGQVEATNRTDGTGAVFTVTLPGVAAAAQA